VLAALVLTVGISLVGSTSYARYLSAIGPAECCKSHCHRGAVSSDADADRCCSVHLGVVPAGLGPTTPAGHLVVALHATAVPTTLTAPIVVGPTVPAIPVMLRGSPPTTLVAVATSLLI
jgi:hypothetical protein